MTKTLSQYLSIFMPPRYHPAKTIAMRERKVINLQYVI